MKKRRKLTVLAWLLAFLLLACGCGSSAKSDAGFVAAETAAATEMPAAEEAEMEKGFYAGSGARSVNGDISSSNSTAAGAIDSPAEMSETAAKAAETTASALANRKLIRTVNMYVETDDFDTLLEHVQNRVTSLGGYIERSDISGQRTSRQGNPIPRSAYFSIRIPSAKLDTFTASVEEGANVINKSENTRDVTLQYSDIESRKKSLTIEQDRIWALLEKADSLESVIALEERLSEIRYELESMESQLRLYDNQVDYSTVDLSIDEVTVYTPTAPETVGERIQNGFARSLKNVTEFCVSFFVSLVSLSPVWVPILILVLIVLGIFQKRHWKKTVKRNAQNTPSAGTDDNTKAE